MKNDSVFKYGASSRTLGFALLFSLALLQVSEGVAKLKRPLDPVVIKSSSFMPDFEGAALNQIKVYRYDAATTLWVLIPSQIDERQGGSYFSGENNGLENNLYSSVDVRNQEDDELVFLAADAGDLAPAEAWIGDVSSRRYPRFEIILTDSLSSQQGYIYVFRTDVGSDDVGLKDYISYQPSPVDGILTDTYGYAHNTHGLFSDLSITPQAGGNGLDFVDRLKVRLKGSGSYSGIPLGTQRITEDNLVKGDGPVAWVVDGKVRVIRKWNVKFYLNPFKIDIKNEVFFKFYPYYVDYADLKIKAPEGLNIEYVRFSFDLDPDASGMRLFSPNNLTGIPVNQSMSDGEPDRAITTPGWNWWMHTGTNGTMLFAGYLPKIGAEQYMYYHDYPTGTNDPDTKFSDTGEGGSWGDTGVKYNGSGITGDISFSGRVYFLGPNLSPDSAATIQHQMASPLKVQVIMNVAVPVELAAFTAVAKDNHITLNWSTASESSNLGFAIERKTGASASWVRIGFVAGSGTGSSPRSYSYEDADLVMGKYQYRLKQTDTDGKFQYSPTVLAEVSAPAEMTLAQNYPNPFNPNTTIHFRIPQKANGLITLSIMDLLGRTVRTLVSEPAQPGYYTRQWDGRDDSGRLASSGVYFYLLTDGQTRLLRKMIKVQ